MYTDFAYIYDELMKDIDYGGWADYIEAIFREKGIKPSLVLDLGCGTGSFCIEMAERGYDMIGLDASEDMLSRARLKSLEAGHDILFLHQDMTGFELYGTVDTIVSLVDSMNYVTSLSGIKKVFKLVKNYLNPGGLFIFDINTPYKLEKVLGDNVFYQIDDDITYIWTNSYDKRKKICGFDLVFFIKDGDSYKRYDEFHSERAYSLDEMKGAARDVGLDVLDIHDELKFSPPREKSQRVFFICRKPEE